MNRLTTTLLLTTSVVACVEGSGSGGTDDASVDPNAFDRPAGFVGCDSAVAYADGLEVQTDSGRYVVRFVSASPSPPDVGQNEWTVEVLPFADELSDPVAEVSLVVTPWMPGHGHGVFPPDFETVTGDDGQGVVGPFPIIMPGFWEFRTSLTLPDGTTENVVLSFCVEG